MTAPSWEPIDLTATLGRMKEQHRANADLCITVPQESCSALALAEILRSIPALVGFHAWASSPGMHRASRLRDYEGFVSYHLLDLFLRTYPVRYSHELMLRRIPEPQDSRLDSDFLETRSDLFASYLSRNEFHSCEPLFPIDAIRHGSYEFVLHAANLMAVFGLQDVSLLKDSVQWACGAIGSTIKSQESTQVATIPRRGQIRLTPDLVAALRCYDEVRLAEEHTSGKTTLRIHLLRSGPTNSRAEGEA